MPKHRQSGSFSSQPSASFTNFAFIAPGVLSLAAWFVIYRWYSLLDLANVPKYALDKVPDHFASPQMRGTALLFFFLTLAYVLNCLLLARSATISRPIRAALGVLIGGTALANVLLYPVGAIDVFYYLAQLKAAYFYGQNPYLIAFGPAYPSDPLTQFGGFLESPLVYGPAWAILSFPVAKLGGFDSILRALIAYKVWSALFVLAAGALIYAYHEGDKKRWLGAGVFVLNPLIWYEAVANAHNDVMMGTFVLAAAWAMKKRSWTALPLLMVAALIKQSAAPLFYVFVVWMIRERWAWKSIGISLGAALATALLFIAPLWAGGGMIEGLKRAVAISQGLNTGSFVSLAREFLQGRGVAEPLIAQVRLEFLGVFVLALLVSPWTFRVFEYNLAIVLALFYLLVGSLFAWYLIPIIGLLALRSDRASLIYIFPASILGLLFNPLSVWAWFNSGLTPFQIHLWEALMLAVPLVGFFVLAARPAHHIAAKEA